MNTTTDKAVQRMELAFIRLLDAAPEQALKLITGMFVSLTVEFVTQSGGDSSGDIHIDSGGKRDITIHARAVAPLG